MGIESKTARRALAPRREPYWHKLSAGFFLGYRKQDTTGSWIARLRDEGTGKQKYHALGSYDANESNEKEFTSARRDAEVWRTSLAAGVVRHDTTVWDACNHYVVCARKEHELGKANDASGRFRRLIEGTPLGKIRLAKLTTLHLAEWRDRLVIDRIGDDLEDPERLRAARAGANRNLASLKAALNRALADDLVATNVGWKAVAPFTSAKTSARRGFNGNANDYLRAEKRQELFAACAPDLRTFVQALFLTATRPGELARCDVGDFNATDGTLNIRYSKTESRIVTLSSSAAELIGGVTAGRASIEPLLARADEKRWTKDSWKKPLRGAVARAKLPSDVVAYSLRHAGISEMIAGGMGASLVAMLAGTSAAMINKHYGHLNHATTRKKLDAASLTV